MPSAPQNFDKILSGEIKGKELIKLNQQAFDDYNTSALESCSNCGRLVYNDNKYDKRSQTFNNLSYMSYLTYLSFNSGLLNQRPWSAIRKVAR